MSLKELCLLALVRHPMHGLHADDSSDEHAWGNHRLIRDRVTGVLVARERAELRNTHVIGMSAEPIRLQGQCIIIALLLR